MLYILIFRNLGKAEHYLQSVSVFTADLKLTGEEAERLYEDNREVFWENFIIWGEVREVSLSNSDLNRTYAADHIMVCGQPSILFPQSDLTYFDIQDKEGCIIDGETAFHLFGSSRVVGKKVEYKDREYIIRAIIPNQKGIFITQSDDNKERLLDTITLKKGDNETQESVYQKIKMLFMEKGKLIDYHIIIDIAYIFIWGSLFYVFLQFYFILRIRWKSCCTGDLQTVIREIRKLGIKNKKTINCLGWCLLKIFILIVFLAAFIHNFKVSPDNFPTKWSDFDFYGHLLESKKESILSFMKMPKRFYEITFISYCLKLFILNICAVFLWMQWQIRNFSARNLEL